jgi:hypothetical protein
MNKSTLAIGLGLSLFFSGLDWVLLTALPRLGLSFGPVGFPLLLLGAARGSFFTVWALLGRSHLQPKRAAWWAALMAPNLLISGLAFYALAVEPFNLQTTRLDVVTHNPPVRPVRILHLTDLHIERITPREREILERADEMQPDLIVLTGDYLSTSNTNDPVAWQEMRQMLSGLRAPLGVYAVNGNTDSPRAMQEIFSGLEVRLLQDEIIRLPLPDRELYLVGLSFQHWERDRAALHHLAQEIPAGETRILLYHTPDLAESASAAGFDLYLAGHTHGGQIRLPFYGALVTLSRYGKRYEMGHYTLGKTHLYVSRGIGMEGWIAPRARFLCSPEIVEITLR